jgi:hypothetical protein
MRKEISRERLINEINELKVADRTVFLFGNCLAWK